MDSAIIVLAGAADWAESLREVIEANECKFKQYVTTESYIPKLADDHAALIVVSGDSKFWQYWTTSPRVNAATHRIPIVVVTDNQHVRESALGSGADFVLAVSEMGDRLPTLITEHGRTTDDAFRNEIVSQCNQPLPPLALEGIQMFNAGEYYKQHDLFEEQWVAEEGPVRDLYRAILQVGIAFFQVQRGNHIGAMKMVLRSIQWLNILPDTCQGVDVAQLRVDADRLREALDEWPEDRSMDEFPQSLLTKVHLVNEASSHDE